MLAATDKKSLSKSLSFMVIEKESETVEFMDG